MAKAAVEEPGRRQPLLRYAAEMSWGQLCGMASRPLPLRSPWGFYFHAEWVSTWARSSAFWENCSSSLLGQPEGQPHVAAMWFSLAHRPVHTPRWGCSSRGSQEGVSIWRGCELGDAQLAGPLPLPLRVPDVHFHLWWIISEPQPYNLWG